MSVVAAASSPAATVYVGLTNGVSAASTRSASATSWTRSAAADIPAVEPYAAPTLGDLDGDGVRDALVGQDRGAVVAWRNAGTNAAPVWTRMAAWDLASVGSRSAPALGDIDGDGDLDLVVGNAAGQLLAFENTGSTTAPRWTARPAWNVAHCGDQSRPTLGDVDGDGELDLVVGTKSGAVVGFRGTGVVTAPFARQTAWDTPVVGTSVTPGLGDIDGDGRPDLLVADSQAKFLAYRNVGATWVAQSGWVVSDPGSGPVGVGLGGGTVSSATTTTLSPTTTTTLPGNAAPVARVTATPTSGVAPLRVHLDASRSSDANGDALTYGWDFGDGLTSAPADPDTLLTTDAEYNAAKALRDGGHYDAAVDAYLALVAKLMPLTTIPTTGPVTAHDTDQVDRVARWYLQKMAHDLGGIYLYHSMGLGDCDRYGTSLQYSRESASQAVAGSFPDLPSLNGTDSNIADATQHLEAAGCAIPPTEPMFTAPSTAGGPVVDHVYAANGTYVARVTVSDGKASANAQVTINVGVITTTTVVPTTVPATTTTLPQPPAAYEGFGATTPGGSGGRVIHVTAPTDAALRAAITDANKTGHAIITFDVQGPFVLSSPLPQLTAPFVTIEGNGATLKGEKITCAAPMLDVRAHDVIVRNLRLRNGGDNIRAQTAAAYNVVFSHLSSTGSCDDGISIGYGAHDVTVQNCFLAGNTRSVFMKYSTTTRVSLHHNWFMKYWIRGPLISASVLADLRNNIIEDWTEWGTRFESLSSGNAVNNLWRLSKGAVSVGGKTNSTLRVTSDNAVFTAGNSWAGMAQVGVTGLATAPYATPPVTTLSVAEMTPVVEANAGCQPRDAIDQAYIDLQSGWTVKDGHPLRLVP